MLELLPGDYALDLAANLAMSTGAQPGDVVRAFTELRAAPDGDRTALLAAGADRTGTELIGQAEDDLAHGRRLSAGDKYRRAAVLLLMAERAQPHQRGGWEELYARVLETFRLGVEHGDERCAFVEVPYEGAALPGLLTVPDGADPATTPALVFVNGLDSTKEMIHGTGLPRELAARGVSTLVLDQPGTGQAIRERGLTGIVESERYAAAAYDFLTGSRLADPRRVGIGGWSLGGYYAPRAAAFEPRLAACVAWGAIFDYGEIQRRRAAAEGARPVPHYWEHVRWAFGQDSREDFLTFSRAMTLEHVSARIHVPYLILHGRDDRQIPDGFAERQRDAAPAAELVVVTPEQGGVAHVGADNMRFSVCRIADWTAETLGADR